MDDKLFKKLMKGVNQSVAHKQGKPVSGLTVHRIAVPAQVDVRAIRQKLRMTQQEFAETFGFSLSGVKKWELGAREPEGAARTLLYMIGKDPKTVLRLAL